MGRLRKTDKIAAIVLGALSPVLMIMLAVDLAGAFRYSAAHEEIYGIPIEAYARQSYAMIAAFLVCAVVSALVLFDRARLRMWRGALYACIVLFLLAVAFAWAALLSAPA